MSVVGRLLDLVQFPVNFEILHAKAGPTPASFLFLKNLKRSKGQVKCIDISLKVGRWWIRQGRRKVWKSGGGGVLSRHVRGIICPLPNWNRVHRSTKIWGGRAHAPSTVFWMEFYVDISWESRCSSEIKVWGHLCHILVVFEVPAQP